MSILRGYRLRPDLGAARRLAILLATVVAALTAASHASAAAGGPGCQSLTAVALSPRIATLPVSAVKLTSVTYMTPPGGAYCKVVGEMAPVDPAAPPIRFQVNLPDRWNHKTVQFGGGGLNGILMEATGGLRDAPPGPTPLELGYATMGTDAGHPPPSPPEFAKFALNDEALINHAYAAYKKTYDVGQHLVRAYYGEAPKRRYYFGGSEGGREGMIAAQRYPDDYDGIVSTVPAMSWALTTLNGYRIWSLAKAGGWLGEAKWKLVEAAANRSCDDLDGLKDGIISDYQGCDARPGLAALRCEGGADTGDGCLSDAQIGLVRTLRSGGPLGVTLLDGQQNYLPLGTGGESNAQGPAAWLIGRSPPEPGTLGGPLLAPIAMRYFITRDPSFNGSFDPGAYRAQIAAMSKLMDPTNPDLTRFAGHGGKLIMKSNTADYIVSPQSIMRYYHAVVAKMGKARVDGFMRYYVNPGVNHLGQGVAGDGSQVPDKVDLLSQLDAWVDRGRPPEPLTVTSFTKEGAAIAARPMCAYPGYPAYVGGDIKLASSFVCRTTPGHPQ